MTKWARMRRRKERRRAQEEPERSHNDGKEMELTQPEQVSKTTNHPQETKKFENLETSKSGTIITQIPRYVYLTALFVLFSGVFFPLITPGIPLDLVIQGTATLFLGVAGAILLFKAITPEKRRASFLIIGFVLIAISLTLIYYIRDMGYSEYFV